MNMLIILHLTIMMLLAGNLTSTQADTEVKNEMATMAAAFTDYQSNNRGQSPLNELQLRTLVTQYLPDYSTHTHPTTNKPYRLTLTPNDPTDIHYQPGFTCSEDGRAAVPGRPRRDLALTTQLPSGSSYCLTN